MNKQVFYDPQRKRWKRLRLIFDMLALVGLVMGTLFLVGLLRMKPLPELLLDAPKRNYKALAAPAVPLLKPDQKLHQFGAPQDGPEPVGRTPELRAKDLRAAYFGRLDDPASYSSLKQHIKQIDLLFPEWLHVVHSGWHA